MGRSCRSLIGNFLVLVIMVLAIVLATAHNAWAIAPFARKYKTSCATCHEAIPRLNAVGEAFRLNGYKFADDELYIKEEPVEMGDEAYKKLWPKAIWPSDIPGLPPLSLVLTSDFNVDVGGTKNARTEFVFPSEIALLGAGALGQSMSMFLELGFNRGGGNEHGAEEAGGTEVEAEGWLQFEDLFGPGNAFNLRIGTVGMHEMGLFTARDHNRNTATPYLYSSWTMPGVDQDEFEMIYGAGAMFVGNPFIIHAQPGIELNGFGRRWRYAVGIVNGNGESVNDNNSDKDVYWQLAWKFGGLGFDGTGMSEEGSLASAQPWRDDSLTLSLFGYHGTALIEIEDMVGSSFQSDDRFSRLGAGGQWKCKDLTVRGGYIWGRNDNPYGILSDQDVTSQSWFAELEYFLYPWLIPTIRYEILQLNLPSGVDSIPENQDRSRIIASIKAMLRANVSLILEGSFSTKDQGSSDLNDDDLALLSLTAAF